ncbi:hypothetical protein HH308_11815 [Gordonia sp. TBRC 11910]|uniref:Uncharacterized protein n=1 Tax=Gordonia asplenii TaxID=2725283 RepID=A0A848KT76_9ACTN|nr:PPA1309 family protein [Gordonia asplenii]NMO01896.1 hypothetical protein [Gordonia asplenii]
MTTPPTGNLSPDALGSALRDVVEFVDAAGWDQPPTLFALVPTSVLAQTQPDLVDEFDTSELSPIAQEPLPTSEVGPGADRAVQAAELEHILATTSWPDAVAGCALVQEIIVLPPEAEADLDDAFEPLLSDPDAADAAARSTALSHPESRAARLIAGALRDGRTLSLLQLRPDEGADDGQIELLSHPDLAPNLVEALAATLENSIDD